MSGLKAVQAPEFDAARLYRPTWSPDSDAIAVYDHTGRVHVVDLDVVRVDFAEEAGGPEVIGLVGRSRHDEIVGEGIALAVTHAGPLHREVEVPVPVTPEAVDALARDRLDALG